MEGTLQDRRTFSRIAAALLALALLAERAAGRSYPVRFLVLAILGRAEAVARAFVAREIGGGGPGPDWPGHAEPPVLHGSPADAGMLALRLRLLAAVLDALAGAHRRRTALSARELSSDGGAPCRDRLG
ncbi:MAG TPA: hypothetical protein GX405_04960, partial [Rhizobiales bacterium]|nr:hypothetical protein [Hyphomicrobiales bacterium]